MVKLKLFTISLLLTAGALLVLIYLKRPNPSDTPKLVRISNNLYITSQLTPTGVRFLRRRGVSTLVDLRPDGEAPDDGG